MNQLFNPRDHHYSYIGLDISFNRVSVAKRAMPDGDFIQSSALNIPLQPSTLDGVLFLGALHHFPDTRCTLEECARVIRAQGFLAGHEPVQTAKITRGKVREIAERMISGYEHSDHDNEIDAAVFDDALSQLHFHVRHRHENLSPIFAIGRIALKNLPWPRIQRPLWKVLFALDTLAIRTICRFSERLEPRALLIVADRTTTN